MESTYTMQQLIAELGKAVEKSLTIPFDPEALMSEKKAAQFLSVSARFLQARRVRGDGPSFIRISARCVKYRKRDLIAWLDSMKVDSTSEASI